MEQRFFETAPPDVPLQPAAPLTFDDLDAGLPERRRRRRPSPARKSQAAHDNGWSPGRRATARGGAAALVLLTSLAAATRRGAAFVGALSRQLGHRLFELLRDGAGRLAVQARDRWRQLVPERNPARELAARAVRRALGPVLKELPVAQTHRGTVLAAVAAVVIVAGLAAVVGAYGPPLTFIR